MSDAVLPLGTVGVILILAAITYGWRAIGFATMGLVPMTPGLRRGLDALPGAIVISTVLPLVAASGAVAAAAVGAACLTMILTRSDFAAVAMGVAMAAGLRLVL